MDNIEKYKEMAVNAMVKYSDNEEIYQLAKALESVSEQAIENENHLDRAEALEEELRSAEDAIKSMKQKLTDFAQDMDAE